MYHTSCSNVKGTSLQLENNLVHEELYLMVLAGQSSRLQDWLLLGLKRAGMNVVYQIEPACFKASQPLQNHPDGLKTVRVLYRSSTYIPTYCTQTNAIKCITLLHISTQGNYCLLVWLQCGGDQQFVHHKRFSN